MLNLDISYFENSVDRSRLEASPISKIVLIQIRSQSAEQSSHIFLLCLKKCPNNCYPVSKKIIGKECSS